MRLLCPAWPGVPFLWVALILGGVLGKPLRPSRSCVSLGQERFPQHPWGPPCVPAPSLPHGIGAPTLVFCLILAIITPGSRAEGLCSPSPHTPRSKLAPPLFASLAACLERASLCQGVSGHLRVLAPRRGGFVNSCTAPERSKPGQGGKGRGLSSEPE